MLFVSEYPYNVKNGGNTKEARELSSVSKLYHQCANCKAGEKLTVCNDCTASLLSRA